MIDLDSTLFNINLGSHKPHSGSLLVAEPFLHEDYFNHAVILLVDYEDSKESMGIVMNRSIGYTLGDLVEELPEDVNIPVFCGGPMSCDRLFYLHTLGDVFSDSRHIIDNLYIGGDFNQVIQYVKEGYPTEGLVRFFVGYSGWSIGQLDNELAKHVWAVVPPLSSGKMLVGSDDSYWHKVVRSMGPKYRGWLYHPMNPTAN